MTEPAQETPQLEEESRFERGVRYGHRTALYGSIVIALAVLIYLIFLIARNADAVRFDYVFGDAKTRLIWLIVISAIAGWVLGIITAYLIRRRTRLRRPT